MLVALAGVVPAHAQISFVCANAGGPVGCSTDGGTQVHLDTTGNVGWSSDDKDDNGAAGGPGGTAIVTVSGTGPFVTYALASGGGGGDGDGAGVFHGATSGGAGGNGGSAAAINLGILQLDGRQTDGGLLARANGGPGGTGGDYEFVNNEGPGGSGGDAGIASATNSAGASITTTATAMPGIVAQADGGAGGYNGYDGVRPGTGAAGNGGIAAVDNQGSITTTAAQSSGVLASSQGGMSSNLSAGVSGGFGGTATVTNEGRIVTQGDNAAAIQLVTDAGAGGRGSAGNATLTLSSTSQLSTMGSGSAGVAISARGGAVDADGGTDGGTVNATAAGSIATTAALSPGLLIDASAGGEGNGGNVTVSSNLDAVGTPTTSGDASPALSASSHGGDIAGGQGGVIGITILGVLQTAGPTASAAVLASSTGGDSHEYTTSLQGGEGGAGGQVTVMLGNSAGDPASLLTSGVASPGISASSIGGAGGGGYPSRKYFDARGGGNGGNGGDIVVTTYGGTGITTSGALSYGIKALSSGGMGGAGGVAGDEVLSSSNGGAGGDGGTGGTVTVDSMARIATSGAGASGIFASSLGGSANLGGSADDAYHFYNANGGTGGRGGSESAGGPSVLVTNRGDIVTTGLAADGIDAESWGGNGGGGGNSSAIFSASGGGGGTSGNAGGVKVDNLGTITTTAEASHGIFGESIGGGGGNGGDADAGAPFVSISVGGGASGGGDGGLLDLSNEGAITTHGDSSTALFGLDVGGGGGNGGSAISTSVGANVSISVALGGNGGAGGSGGQITLANSGTIDTDGKDSPGLQAFSIGGGGGVGGQANASAYAVGVLDEVPSIAVAVAVGGAGGIGGIGGQISVANTGRINTVGDDSAGIAAMSIGGGGGDAGDASTYAYTFRRTPALHVGVAIGGSGGTGGDGGNVVLASNGAIGTAGFASSGLYAASIGGGGGDGSVGESESAQNIPVSAAEWVALPFEQTASVNIGVGGSGGSGGAGGMLGITNSGVVTTIGADSRGIFVQSIGGGGGIAAAGSAEGSSDYEANISVGGSGGAGGAGGAVTVSNAASGAITTSGDGAYGIEAQSIGGGGGSGGSAASSLEGTTTTAAAQALLKSGLETLVSKILPKLAGKYGVENKVEMTASLQVAIGGSGGAAGDGGQIVLGNDGPVTTAGTGAFGLFGQSVGGGGGDGGAATSEGSKLLGVNLGLGGSGGASGNGGDISLVDTGTITTTGATGFGMVAQSVGGGGGLGAVRTGDTGAFGVVIDGGEADSFAGRTGSGGPVSVTNNGLVQTNGVEAHGIVAQSLGAGGGLFLIDAQGSPTILSSEALADTQVQSLLQQISTHLAAAEIDLSQQAAAQDADTEAAQATVSLGLGSDASASGAGGAVSISQTGRITTSGANAFGVIAQSIGGGGGLVAGAMASGLPVGVSGTLGGGTGGAGTVTLSLDGSIATSGTGAIGILAQSIGGGGGYTGALSSASASGAFLAGSTTGIGGGSLVILQNDTPTGSLAITTSGVAAHGAVLQSLSDGGGLVGSQYGVVLPINGDTARNGSVDGAISGGIDVNISGHIVATGLDAVGLYAQSGVQGQNGGIVAPGGPIAIAYDGDIHGGGGTGAAIQIDGGNANTVTLLGGTVDAGSGTAILADGGSVAISNAGTLVGNIVTTRSWGDDVNMLTNMVGGVFVTGNNVDLAGGSLENHGTVALGRYGTYGVTRLNGSYTQANQGELIAHVDFQNRLSSVLQVSGTANVAGTLRVDLANPAPGAPLPVIEATGGVSGTMSASTGLFVYSYETATTPDALTLGLRASFKSVPGLTTDQASVAGALQQEWDQGGSDSKYNAFTKVVSLAAYRNALTQLTPSATSTPASNAASAAQKLITNMMSCPYFPGQDSLTREGDCSWMRVTGGHTRQTATGDDTGYEASDVTYQVGGQTHVAPNWIVGGSLAYGTSWYDADDHLSRGAGRDVSAGLAVKYQPGRWLFAGALDGGAGWYDNSRQIDFDQIGATARSRSLLEHVSGRFRPSYQLPFGQSYARLYADIDTTWAHVPQYTERGAETYDLTVRGASQVTVTASPMIELGGRIHRAALDLKPYVAIGLTARSNDGWVTRARFADDQLSANDFDDITRLPRVTANGTVGIDLLQAGGFEIKGYYTAKVANSFLAQEGSIRIGYRF